MGTHEDRWFEVWFTQGEDLLPTWLLVVIPDVLAPNQVLIHDPLSNNKLVYRASSYDDAVNWLCEDEYELVRGRIFPDDGWPLATAGFKL